MRISCEHFVWVLSVAIAAALIGTLLHASTSPFKGTSSFYVWHPVLMSLGFCLLVSQGIIAYVADFGLEVRSDFAADCDSLSQLIG
jgi:hypothetical protein